MPQENQLLTLEEALERLQVKRCVYLAAQPSSALNEERTMQVWKRGDVWHYEMHLLGESKSGNFDAVKDKALIEQFENIVIETQEQDITTRLETSDLRLNLSRPYLRLTPREQRGVQTVIYNCWPRPSLDEIFSKALAIIIYEAILYGRCLDHLWIPSETDGVFHACDSVVMRMEVYDAVRSFRPLLFPFNVNKFFRPITLESNIADILGLIRCLFLSAAQAIGGTLKLSQLPRIPEQYDIRCGSLQENANENNLLDLVLNYQTGGLKDFTPADLNAFETYLDNIIGDPSNNHIHYNSLNYLLGIVDRDSIFIEGTSELKIKHSRSLWRILDDIRLQKFYIEFSNHRNLATFLNCVQSETSIQTKKLLCWAAQNGDLAVVQALIGMTGNNAPRIDAVDRALALAAQYGDLAVVQALIGMTGNNAPRIDAVERALALAAQNGHPAVVQALIGMTGNNAPRIDAVDSALALAAQYGHLAVVQALIGMTGKNASSIDAVGKVLALATQNGYTEEVVEALNQFIPTLRRKSQLHNATLELRDSRCLQAQNAKDVFQALSCDDRSLAKEWICFFLDNPDVFYPDVFEKLKDLIQCQTQPELTQALETLHSVKNSDAANSTYHILKLAQLSFAAGVDAMRIKTYLSRQKQKLRDNIQALQSISREKTNQNILAAMMSVLLACTIVGIPISMWLWNENVQHRGDRFRFFTEGAKQSAEIAHFQVELNLSR